MGLVLLIAFIGVPIIEIAVFIEVGGWLGLWPTLGLVILTAVVGSLELRAQGLATVNKLRRQLDAGELPSDTLFDGVCLLFAGALLLTPGFVTDIVGMALFLPPFRRFLRATLGRYIARHAEARVFADGGGGGPRGGRQPDDVIDADYEEVRDPESRDRPGGERLPR